MGTCTLICFPFQIIGLVHESKLTSAHFEQKSRELGRWKACVSLALSSISLCCPPGGASPLWVPVPLVSLQHHHRSVHLHPQAPYRHMLPGPLRTHLELWDQVRDYLFAFQWEKFKWEFSVHFLNWLNWNGIDPNCVIHQCTSLVPRLYISAVFIPFYSYCRTKPENRVTICPRFCVTVPCFGPLFCVPQPNSHVPHFINKLKHQ